MYSPLVNAEFRHDPPGRPWSWGLNYEARAEGASYLVDQVDALTYAPRLGGFVETTRWRGLRTRLSVRRAATERIRRFRTFYEPDRSGLVSATENRRSARGAFVNLTVSEKF